MEEDNARAGDLIVADDPFGAEGRVAYVRALVPDVALLHGWVADRAGNVITASPLNENMYGAMAARGGAVVTVERIVSTDFIRRHADLVRLPSQYVRAVVETPHGNHPGGMYGMNVPELEGYAEDMEWILECRRAFRKADTADAWIREWMLEVPDHAAYLSKLGYGRIMETKGRAHTDAWVSELDTPRGAASHGRDGDAERVDGGGGRPHARREGARPRLQDLPGRGRATRTWPPGWPPTSSSNRARRSS